MKRFLFVLAAAVLLIPTTSFANDTDLAVYASYWGPSDGGDAAGLGGRLGIPAITDQTQFEFRAGYFDDLSKSSQPDIEVIPLELGFAIKPRFPLLRPFASVGGGYYLLDASEGISIDDEWGFYAAAGLEILLPLGISIFSEINYRWVEAEVKGDLRDFDTNRFTEDYDLSGVGVNVGINYRW